MLAERNDAIEDSVQEPVILEEGDYSFTVIGVDHGRYPGGKGIPPCNRMTLTLQVETEKGIAVIQTAFFLYRPLVFRILSFYQCVSFIKPDRKAVVIGSDTVLGCRGRAHFKPRVYEDHDGNENVIERILIRPAPSSLCSVS